MYISCTAVITVLASNAQRYPLVRSLLGNVLNNFKEIGYAPMGADPALCMDDCFLGCQLTNKEFISFPRHFCSLLLSLHSLNQGKEMSSQVPAK